MRSDFYDNGIGWHKGHGLVEEHGRGYIVKVVVHGAGTSFDIVPF